MRIATSTLTNLTTGAMGSSYNNYANIIKKIVSNRNFQKVSENVPDATRVLKLKDQLAKLDEYQSNIQAATNEMNLAYDTLGDVADEMSNISALITEASNATTTPESAIALADEIKQRVETIKDKMNQKYLDNYIFSGTYTQEQTYTTDENGYVSYNGSPKSGGDRNLTISEDTKFTYNITGEEILGAASDDENFFNQMKELDDLLRDTNGLDYNAIREKIGTTQKTISNVTQMQGRISGGVTKLEMAKDINTTTITNLTEQRTDLEEVDITKAASELASAQTALQASYIIGTNVMQGVSLLDYL